MNKFYWVDVGCLILEILLMPWLLFGVAVFLAAYFIYTFILCHKRNMLRLMKFKLRRGVDNDMMFRTMQPILQSKYSMQTERTDGVMTVVHEGFMYDILIEPDSTFRISWRPGRTKEFIPKNKYKAYKLNFADMVLVAYEIQKAFEIAA